MEINISSQEPTDRRVRLTWAEPSQPNGVVIIYEIEYAKIDSAYVAAKGDATTTESTRRSDVDDSLGSGVRLH